MTILKQFDAIQSDGSSENANKDSKVFPTQRDLTAGLVAKAKAREIIPEHIMEAHDNGVIHFHDLDYSPAFGMFNCMLIDVEGMFRNGFSMGNAEIETPKSIKTAAAVTAQIIAQVASHIYGGNTINRIDEVLAPYVRKSYDKYLAINLVRAKGCEKTAACWAKEDVEKETYDAMQGLEYEVNTLHTANGQTPFCTFGFGLGTSWEARLIQACILRVRLAGLGKSGRTAVFPKLTFAVKEGLNRRAGDPNYDIKELAIECASKRMYPDVLNYDKLVEVTGGFKAPMGCRSFLDGGSEGVDGRNNMGVVSINLPRLAYRSASVDAFWLHLDRAVGLAKQALDCRVERLKQVQAKSAPILYLHGACGLRAESPDEFVFDRFFSDGRASISMGYIGIHEVCEALGVGREFGVEIVRRLKEKCNAWKEEDGLGWSLYATPSESLCDRFYRLDAERGFPVDGKGYYTNSFHQCVLQESSPFTKLDLESEYPRYSSGGHISYVELPRVDAKNQAILIETIWDYTYDKLPYIGVNIPIDTCYDCGHSGDTVRSELGFSCSHCGSTNVEVTKRVCGYLSAPNARPFNDGKQQEVINRVKHR